MVRESLHDVLDFDDIYGHGFGLVPMQNHLQNECFLCNGDPQATPSFFQHCMKKVGGPGI